MFFQTAESSFASKSPNPRLDPFTSIRLHSYFLEQVGHYTEILRGNKKTLPFVEHVQKLQSEGKPPTSLFKFPRLAHGAFIA